MQLLQHFKELTIRPKNAKELKGLILQLAVQGKLTQDWRLNNPNIKNASANLELIKAEKELQHVKENEFPFKLNPSWEWAKFIDVAVLRHGHQFRKYDFVEDGIPVIKIGQCKADGTLDFSKCNYIDSSRKDEFENDLIFKGHLLMALTGGTLGKVTRVDKDYGVLVQNYRVGNFFADERVITLDFLNVILESELFQSLVREKINQNAQPNIGKDSIEKIVMPLPPLEEQKEIVNVVETLFKEVEQLEQLTVERISLKEDFVTSALNQLTTNNANQEWTFLQDHFKSFFNETTSIKKLRETVLQLAVQGKLTADWRANNPDTEDASVLLKRIQKEKAQLVKDKKIKKEKIIELITQDEIHYDLPESWVWCRMIELCQYITDGTHQTPNYTEKGRMFLSAKNVKPFKFMPEKHRFVSEEDFEGYRRNRKPELNDILLTRVGAGIGEATLIDQDLEFAIYVSVGLLKMFPGLLEPNYIVMWLNSPEGRQYSSKNTYGKGVSQGNLNLSLIRKFVVSLPPLDEQKAIVQKVNALMGLCDRLEQEVEQSQEHSEMLMQSVLREVFEGERKMEEV